MAPPRKRVITANTENTLSAAHEVVDEFTTKVIVPHAFKLTQDNGIEVHYHAGIQLMPNEHFAHWFTRAQGVIEAPAEPDPDFAETQTGA